VCAFVFLRMYTLLKFDSLTEAKQAVLDLIDQNVTLEELYEEIQVIQVVL